MTEEDRFAGIGVADLVEYCWHHGELSYKLDDLQRSIRDTVARLKAKKVAILSSRQIGKSYWAVVYALEYLLRHPNKIARIVAPTLKQCNEITNDNITPIIADAPQGLVIPERSKYRWNLLNGSSLRLGPLERQYVDMNRGGNASLIIYEECGFVSQEDFTYGVDSVLGPQLLRSAGAEVFVSSPSEDPDHPLHTKVLPECEAAGTAFRYTVYDSPSITPDMIAQAIARCGGEDSDAFRREYLAQIIRPSTLVVIPPFDERVHVREFDWPLAFHCHVTMDAGGVRDKTDALLHSYDFEHDLDLIYDERVWDANTSTDKIVADLKAWQHPTTQSNWCDAAGQTLVDMNALGWPVQLPQKSDWLATVQAMVVRFSLGKIWIHPRCEFLRKSCKAAIFNKNRTDFERLPELGHCDAVAALMYAIRMQDRSNPHAPIMVPRENTFGFRPQTELEGLSKAMAPKVFGGFRR